MVLLIIAIGITGLFMVLGIIKGIRNFREFRDLEGAFVTGFPYYCAAASFLLILKLSDIFLS